MRSTVITSLLLVGMLLFSCTRLSSTNPPDEAGIISSPARETVWKLDSTYTIGWSGIGLPSDSVRILLMQDSTVVYTIGIDAHNSGSYHWTVANVRSGTYRIKVAPVDNSSVAVTGQAFTIQSDYRYSFSFSMPQADSTYLQTQPLTIAWSSSGAVGANVSLHLFQRDTKITDIASGVADSTGKYTWTLPSNIGKGRGFRIKISAAADTALSALSDSFEIASLYYGSFSITQPDSGDTLGRNDTLKISWTTTGQPGSNAVLKLFNDDSLALTIVDKIAIDGSYHWAVPDSIQPGSSYTVKICSFEDTSIFAMGGSFAIIADTTPLPGGTSTAHALQTPASGSVWYVDSSHTISWQINSIADSVALYLCEDTLVAREITASTADDGNYLWVAPRIDTGHNYRIRIAHADDTTRFSYSHTFTIASLVEQVNITITAPNDTSTIMRQVPTDITWELSDSLAGSVSIALFSDIGLISQVAGPVTAHDGSLLWYPDWEIPVDSTYFLKITSNEDSTIVALSDTFTVLSQHSGALALTSPDTGDAFDIADQMTINWTAQGYTFDSIAIQLLADSSTGDKHIHTIREWIGTGNQTYTWFIYNGLETRSDYRIRIYRLEDTTRSALSGMFTIEGLARDTFEYDDRYLLAPLFNFGAGEQKRTLLENEIDWVSFSSDSARFTVFRTAGDIGDGVNIQVYDSSGGQFSRIITEQADSVSPTTVAWTAAAATSYFIRFESDAGFGEYAIEGKQYDTTQSERLTVTYPTVSTSAARGSNIVIQWQPDTLLLSDSVVISLFKGSDSIGIVHASTATPNDGGYNWQVPSLLSIGNNYRLQFQNYRHPETVAFSKQFTISFN
ncbi:MAG: hypothetical protein GF398_13215 [Chitinivibrionales bacterium]|nr:hypothetical protein [Chitinivibrionales bacterium]